MDIRFEVVSGSAEQINTLYELLNTRKHFISNRGKTSFGAHAQFVKNNHYRIWYIVYQGDKPVGSFYIHENNAVGINLHEPTEELAGKILEFVKSGHEPAAEVKSTIPPYFYVNVPASDTALSTILKAIELPKIQETFEVK